MKFSAGAATRPAAHRRAALHPILAGAALLALTIGLMLAGAALGRPGQSLRADSPAAERALVRFHDLEHNETDAFRWSEPLAAIFLYGFEGQPAALELRLAAPRPPEAPPVEMTVSLGEAGPGRFALAPGWRRYHLLTPTDGDGETALQLEITPFSPPGDPRELGLVLSELEAAPLRAAGPTLPVRAIFLLTLPLIGWLLALRLGAAPWLALVLGAALAIVAGWARAEPTAAGYWLPTLGWPWWPVLPLALLILAPQLGAGLAAARRQIEARPALAWCGLALALAALLAIRAGLPALPAMLLFVAGVWVGLPLARRGQEGSVAAAEQEEGARSALRLPGSLVAALLLTIVAVALCLRFYNLDGQPAGLWRDESRHGLRALQIWEDPTYRPVYVVEGADLPALLFYLMAPVVGLLGPTAWSVRLVSALAGALTPLALYWAAGPLVGRRGALLGAALYAWASWSLSMSRWAFPATLDHLLVLTAVGLLWRGLGFATAAEAGGKNATIRAAAMLAAAGLLGGLATYAYHTGRMAPVALAVVAAVRLGPSATAWRRAAPALAAAALAGLLTMAPLIGYVLADLDGYNRRVGNVSVFDSSDLTTRKPLGLLLRNVERYALMWHLRGEGNGRHHLPAAPMLDPAAGLLLGIGLGLALPAARRGGTALALLMFWAVYFVPGVFSGNAPHAMRSLGTLAPACALAGLGLAALAGELRSASAKPSAIWQARGTWLIGGALLASLLFNCWIYFGVMRVEPRVYGEFDLVETAMGRAAQAGPAAGVTVYVPEQLARTDTVRFLAHLSPPRPYAGAPIPGADPALLLLPAEATDEQRAAALAALGPGATELGPLASAPGDGPPLVFAFGRGDAAQALVERLRP